MIELLHFLRPLWLLAIPATACIWWLVRGRSGHRAGVGGLVAPHLRDALTINRDAQRGMRAVDGVAAAMIVAALAAAGPTWSKQASPWFSETAPLIVAIEVSDSMRSNDLLPTRLDRARFKLLDLLAERTGSRTALIAYAGSAHIVLPPSTDPGVLKVFLESLDPEIMPEGGARATTVLPLARELLANESAAGTLLFVNDGFESADVAELSAFSNAPGAPAMAALVVGTDAGGVALLPDGSTALTEEGSRVDTAIDTDTLQQISRQSSMAIIRSGTGNADIRGLMRAIESNLRQADDPDARWLDQGWWLLWPAMLLCLAWFRRGWTMQW